LTVVLALAGPAQADAVHVKVVFDGVGLSLANDTIEVTTSNFTNRDTACFGATATEPMYSADVIDVTGTNLTRTQIFVANQTLIAGTKLGGCIVDPLGTCIEGGV